MENEVKTKEKEVETAETAVNTAVLNVDQLLREAETEMQVVKYVLDRISSMKKRETTRLNQKSFLEFYPKVFHISATCKKIGIGERTYYDWMEKDPEFASAFYLVSQARKTYVEDKLFKRIQEDDGPSIRYFLDRHHPDYKPKVEATFIPAGQRSYTQQLWEEARQKFEAEGGKIIEAEVKENKNDGTDNKQQNN